MFPTLSAAVLSRITLAHQDGSGAQSIAPGAPFRIKVGGRWIYNGEPVERAEMVSLFGCLLERGDGGVFFLDTPSGRERVEVEDAPFMAVQVFSYGGCGEDQVLSMLTNIDEIVTVDAAHPLRVVFDGATDGRAKCYVTVRDGLEARLEPDVFDAVSARGVERYHGDTVCFGVWSSGTFFPLGCLNDRGSVVAPEAEVQNDP